MERLHSVHEINERLSIGSEYQNIFHCSGVAHQRKLWSPPVCACRTCPSAIPCLQALHFKQQPPSSVPHVSTSARAIHALDTTQLQLSQAKNGVTVKSITACCSQSINPAIWDNISISQILSLGNAPVPAG